MKKYLGIIFLILGLLLYSYLLGALVTWLFSLAFGFKFTWLRAFCIWLALSILTGGITVKVKK